MNSRTTAIGASLLLAAGLAVSGCGSSGSTSAGPACPAKTGKAVTASSPVAPAVQPAAGWTLPGADLTNTRDVASAITSSNVSKLGVAWTVPLRTSTAHSDGAYATTPVILNGVVYLQDLQSNVMAISLASGLVRALVRRPGQRVHRRGQPRPALRHHKLPAGQQPAGP
jgi:glucose dehydrogenase